MSDIDYKRLAQEIVAEQSKEFLSFDEVCVMLGYKRKSSAVKKITEQDDFPQATQLTLSFIEESQIISREPLSTRGSLIF